MLLKGACDAGFDLLGDPDRVEIGHAGYEVDDNHILRAAPVFILRRDELPMRVEVPVEGPDDLLGRLTEDTPRLGDIDCLEYEIAKLVECGSDLVAHGDHGTAWGVGAVLPGCGPRAGDNVGNQAVDALGVGVAKDVRHRFGKLTGVEHSGPECVGEVVVEVGDRVGYAADLAFERQVFDQRGVEEVSLRLGVSEYPLPDLPRQVESLAVLFKPLDDSEALAIVPEAVGVQHRHFVFADVSEGGVTKIVSEGDGFGEVFVEVQCAGDRSGDLRDLEGVGKTGDVVVSERGDEDLCLVFKASKGLGVDYAVAVALELGAHGRGRFGQFAALARRGTHGVRRETVFAVGQTRSEQV